MTTLELQSSVRRIAAHREGDNVETRIRRVQRTLRVTYWQARDLWYGKVKDPRASVIAKVAAIQSPTKEDCHAATLERAAAALEAIDDAFHRAEIDRLRHVARQLRGLAADQGR